MKCEQIPFSDLGVGDLVIREPGRAVGYNSWGSAVYFGSIILLGIASLFATVSSSYHNWLLIILIALFIAVLDAYPANVYTAQITVTSSVVFASVTNFGLFSTELSLLLSLPFLFWRYRRGRFVVLFNTSLYSLSMILAFEVYRGFGGKIGLYGNHPLAIALYVLVYSTAEFVGTTTALFLNYRGSVRELLRRIWFHILGAYLVEMLLGMLAGMLYQMYGVWGFVTVFVVLFFVIGTYKRYFETAQEVEIDGLTDLYSRRAFQQQTAWHIKKGRSLSLLMIDVDHFKHVNDSLGHSAGDMVLRETAQLLAELIGPSDVIGRYGGEEFCLLSFDEHPGMLAERLRTAVSQFSFSTNDDLQLTVSIGIASCPQDANEWSSLFECTDKALYEAKLHRNTVRVYSPTLSDVGAHS